MKTKVERDEDVRGESKPSRGSKLNSRHLNNQLSKTYNVQYHPEVWFNTAVSEVV